jgi:hypothetical protein
VQSQVYESGNTGDNTDSKLVNNRMPSSGERIHWKTISAGGGYGISSQYQVHSCFGQTASGLSVSTLYQVNAGYLQHFTLSGGCCAGIRGDCNSDGADGDIVDLTFIADFLFAGGPAPLCEEEGDVNGDSAVSDIVDLTFIADFLFAGGPAPAACP